MTPVNSSHVNKVGVHEGDLLVEYRDGAMYRYFGAAHHYEPILALAGNASVGKYIDVYLKKARVPFDRLALVPKDDNEGRL